MKTIFGLIGLMLGWWLFINLLGAIIIGALARFLLPGKDRVGFFTTILVGFLGGIVGNIVAHLAGWVPWGKNTGILGSLLGAMGLLLIHRIWAMSRAPKTSLPPA